MGGAKGFNGPLAILNVVWASGERAVWSLQDYWESLTATGEKFVACGWNKRVVKEMLKCPIFSRSWNVNTGLTINPKKCALAKKEVECLGYIIGSGKISHKWGRWRQFRPSLIQPPRTRWVSWAWLGGTGSSFPTLQSIQQCLQNLPKLSASNKTNQSEDCDSFQRAERCHMYKFSAALSWFWQAAYLQKDASGLGGVIL